MDPDDLRKKITRRTKAIIPVHLYGHMAYMDEILEMAKKKNIKIIEDASQSLGSKLKGKHSGTFSHLGCFSLYAGKVITSGEGGAIVTDDKKLFEKLRQIRNHGLAKNNLTTRLGLNLRLSEINAAIAKIQMKKLPRLISQRKKNAQILTDLLKNDDVILPQQRKNETTNWYLYTIAVKKQGQNNEETKLFWNRSKNLLFSTYSQNTILQNQTLSSKYRVGSFSCPKLTNTSKSKKTRFGKNEKDSLIAETNLITIFLPLSINFIFPLIFLQNVIWS